MTIVVMDINTIDHTESIDSLKKSVRVENVKLLHPAFRLQLNRTSKRKKWSNNILKILENEKIINPFEKSK